MAFPTRELLSVVNTAHAVLVLRGENDYFYLRDDFVQSAREEEALVEWGIGRPLSANSTLAVGGTLLVVCVEKFWGPAVVGTLLVATAGYRVQGVLTKVLRIRSSEWKTKHKLVPSGIHGTERVIQGVLVTLVALADLLDHRMLLLSTLILASVQVVLLKCVGQAHLTWGRKKYTGVLCAQLCVLTCVCVGLVAWLWLAYVFVKGLGCMVLGLDWFVMYVLVMASCLGDWSRHEDDRRLKGRWVTVPMALIFFGSVGWGIWLTVLGWDDADLMFSRQSLQPWAWSLSRAPNYFQAVDWAGFIVGLLGDGLLLMRIVMLVFLFRIGSDGDRSTGLGERTRARKKEDSPGFIHYDKNPIPSRNLLVAGVGQPAPVASIV